MVTFTKHFCHYSVGKEFVLWTDHNSLHWLHNFQGLEGQLAHWVEQLASFQYKIVYCPGKLHSNAEALYRLPDFLRDGPQFGLQAPQGVVGSVECSIVCHLKRGEMDELSQGQMAELQRITDDKKQGHCKWKILTWKGMLLFGINLKYRGLGWYRSPCPLRCCVSGPSRVEKLHSVSTGRYLEVQKLQGKVKNGWVL